MWSFARLESSPACSDQQYHWPEKPGRNPMVRCLQKKSFRNHHRSPSYAGAEQSGRCGSGPGVDSELKQRQRDGHGTATSATQRCVRWGAPAFLGWKVAVELWEKRWLEIKVWIDRRLGYDWIWSLIWINDNKWMLAWIWDDMRNSPLQWQCLLMFTGNHHAVYHVAGDADHSQDLKYLESTLTKTPQASLYPH